MVQHLRKRKDGFGLKVHKFLETSIKNTSQNINVLRNKGFKKSHKERKKNVEAQSHRSSPLQPYSYFQSPLLSIYFPIQ